MLNIIEYMDYRQFLKDYYERKKSEDPGFSHRVFSEESGFKNKGVISNLMAGRANLAPKSISGLTDYFKFSKKEAHYFECLVKFNQAKKVDEKNRLYEELESIRIQRREVPEIRATRKYQYEFYSRHYHSVIRALIDIHDFKDEYENLAKMIKPPITPGQAKKSVQLLEKLKLIVKGDDGIFRLSDKVIKTSHEILELGTLNFHRQALKAAEHSIKDVTEENRYVSGVTMGISKKTYEKIKEMLEEVQKKIMGKLESDTEADRVYQLNIQMFKAAKQLKDGVNREKA